MSRGDSLVSLMSGIQYILPCSKLEPVGNTRGGSSNNSNSRFIQVSTLICLSENLR